MIGSNLGTIPIYRSISENYTKFYDLPLGLYFIPYDTINRFSDRPVKNSASAALWVWYSTFADIRVGILVQADSNAIFVGRTWGTDKITWSKVDTTNL